MLYYVCGLSAVNEVSYLRYCDVASEAYLAVSVATDFDSACAVSWTVCF